LSELIQKKHDLIRSLERKEITKEYFDKVISILETQIDIETKKGINEKIKNYEAKNMENDKGDYISDDIGVLFKTLEDNIINRIKELLGHKIIETEAVIGIRPVITEEVILEKKHERIPRERSRWRVALEAMKNPKFNTRELVIEEVIRQRPEDNKKQVGQVISSIISSVDSGKLSVYIWDEDNYLLKEK
jgi:hypothetical protein